jgi:DNA-binding Xre family transcriptional regulator
MNLKFKVVIEKRKKKMKNLKEEDKMSNVNINKEMGIK